MPLCVNASLCLCLSLLLISLHCVLIFSLCPLVHTSVYILSLPVFVFICLSLISKDLQALSICPSVTLFLSLSLFFSFFLSVCLSVCLSLFFYLPLSACPFFFLSFFSLCFVTALLVSITTSKSFFCSFFLPAIALFLSSLFLSPSVLPLSLCSCLRHELLSAFRAKPRDFPVKSSHPSLFSVFSCLWSLSLRLSHLSFANLGSICFSSSLSPSICFSLSLSFSLSLPDCGNLFSVFLRIAEAGQSPDTSWCAVHYQ